MHSFLLSTALAGKKPHNPEKAGMYLFAKQKGLEKDSDLVLVVRVIAQLRHMLYRINLEIIILITNAILASVDKPLVVKSRQILSMIYSGRRHL